METTMKICLAADNRYLQHLVVTISSVLINAEASDAIDFLILTDGSIDAAELNRLAFPRECRINVVNATELVRENMDIPYNSRWPEAAYYRLLLPDLCNLDDRIIYLDCDIIVRGSLSPLWTLPLEQSIAGVVDTGFDHKSRLANRQVEILKEYINSGVTVWNLKRMRENDYSRHLRSASKVLPDPEFPDQDWINIMFDTDKKILPPCWNAMSHFFIDADVGMGPYTEEELNAAKTNPKICHFTNIKPWTMTYTRHPYWTEYWDCLKETGFARLGYKGWLKRMFLNKPDSLVLRTGRFLRGH